MTTQLAFAFGVLVMIAITMLVAIVIGMVKVIRLEKQHKDLDRACSKETEFLHRHMTDIERGIYSELNETRRRFDEISENLRREVNGYTDSRIDKLVSSIKPDSAKKQQLNG